MCPDRYEAFPRVRSIVALSTRSFPLEKTPLDTNTGNRATEDTLAILIEDPSDVDTDSGYELAEKLSKKRSLASRRSKLV